VDDPAALNPGARGVGKQTRRAIKWSIANAIGSNLIRLAVFAILGRLLEPADFGIVAAAMLVILFAGMLRDLGLGQALVQRKELEREHVEVAFTVTVVQGVVLTIAVTLLADPIADFFEMETSAAVVRALSVLFILRSLGIVPNFVLQRAMRFRALSLIDLVAYTVGSATSVTLAYLDHGPWSLVVGYGVETLIFTGAVSYLSSPPWRLRWHPRHLRDLLGFGIAKSIAGFGNYFANQGDYMVIGRVLDKTQLGLYQRAYELVRFPANVFTAVAGSALFSAVSKVQEDPERMGRMLRRMSFASALVLLPASAGLIVLAPEVIRILIGDQWSDAVWPFRIMACTMLFRTTYKLGGVVGRSTGEVFAIARWQWIYAALVIGGAALSVYWGILGVACTTSIAIVANFIGMYRIGLRMTNVRAIDLVMAHAAPLAIAVVVGGVAWLTATLLREHAGYVVVAAVSSVTGSLVFVTFVIAGIKRGGGDWPWLAESLAGFIRKRKRIAAQGEM
jgi:O-antigen/teichoic acid export membrane protein